MDSDATLRVVSSVLGCHRLGDVPGRVLAPLSALVGASSGIAIEFHRRGDELEVSEGFCHRVSQESFALYANGYAKIDPLVLQLRKRGFPSDGLSACVRYSPLQGGREQRQTPFCRDFMRRFGLGHILGLLIKSPFDARWIGFGFHRRDDEVGFLDQDRQTIVAVAPALAQAWGMFALQDHLDGALDTAEAYRRQLSSPDLVVFDQHFEVLDSGRYRRDDKRFVHAMETLRGLFREPEFALRLNHDASAQVIFDGFASHLRCFERPPGRRVYVLHVDGAGELGKSSPDAGCLGLSRRERAVADLILVGLANGEIARSLGVSTRTIDHHLASIYRKLSIKSRTQLIARILAGARQPNSPH